MDNKGREKVEYALQHPDGYINPGTISGSKRTTTSMRCYDRSDTPTTVVKRTVTPWVPAEGVSL